MRTLFRTCVFLCILTLFPCTGEASSLSLSPQQSEVRVGDTFYVDVHLNTENETINAVGTSVEYPYFVRFLRAEEAGSLVSLWVTRPYDADGAVQFEGVTPGGIVGTNLDLARLFFEVVSEGQGLFTFRDSSVLLHDGYGTPSVLTLDGVHVTTVFGTATRVARPSLDEEPPEPFELRVIEDPDVHEGMPSLVYTTQDKFSGISHYEVREGILGGWVSTDSPYRLQYSPGSRMVTVRAVDEAGNIRVAVLYPHPLAPYLEHIWVVFSILAISALLFLWLFYTHRKR